MPPWVLATDRGSGGGDDGRGDGGRGHLVCVGGDGGVGGTDLRASQAGAGGHSPWSGWCWRRPRSGACRSLLLVLYIYSSATVGTVIQSCTRTFGRGKVRAVNLAGAGSNLVALTGSMRIFDMSRTDGRTDILANTAYPSFESTTDRTPTRS